MHKKILAECVRWSIDGIEVDIKRACVCVCMCVCVCVCLCVFARDSRASMALDLSRQSIYSVLRGAYKQMLSNFSQE